MSASSAESPTSLPPEPLRESLHIEILMGIFAVVAIMLWILMYPTWQVDWHTYQKSMRLQQKDYKTAITHLQWMLHSNTPAKSEELDSMKNPTYLSEIGLCYMGIGDYKKAEEYYRLAQQYTANVMPDDQGNTRESADFTTDIAIAQYRQGQIDAAEQTLQSALKKNKLDPQANYTLGEIEMKRGNYVNAAKYFKVVAHHEWYEAKVKEHYAEIEKKLFKGTS